MVVWGACRGGCCWGSGRCTDTVSVNLSWVVWIDRPSWWQQSHQSGFSHPQLPISGDLNLWHLLFTLKLSLWPPLSKSSFTHRRINCLFILIVRSDINFLWTRLFRRHSPPVYVMRSLLLLLRVGTLLLQLLTLEFRPSVLKPHFYLRREIRGENWISVTRWSAIGQRVKSEHKRGALFGRKYGQAAEQWR